MSDNPPTLPTSSSARDKDSLFKSELFWRDHQPWLKERGYLLRPRYDPNWVPSWKATNKSRTDCEDGQVHIGVGFMDAVQVSDGSFVALKRIKPSKHPEEVKIARLLCSEPLTKDSRNHCVPIYDVLDVPDEDDLILLVMPLLFSWNWPEFDTIGEAIDFFRQIFEGLQFMHSQHVAHRDCKGNNIMMDAAPLYDRPRHPASRLMRRDWKGTAKAFNRTRRPVKYYFIDFGISRQYDSAHTLDTPAYGGDQTVPEYNSSDLCNPFATDVYCIGNIIRTYFTAGTEHAPKVDNFKFMGELVTDMCQDDPTKRPTMDEVVSRFADIRQQLSWWKLRSRISSQRENRVFAIFLSTAHYFKQAYYIARRIPAVPAP